MHVLKYIFCDNNTTWFLLFGMSGAVLTSRKQWIALQPVNAINNGVNYCTGDGKNGSHHRCKDQRPRGKWAGTVPVRGVLRL